MKPKFTMNADVSNPLSKAFLCGRVKATPSDKDRALRWTLIAITRMYYEEVVGIALPKGKCFCIATGGLYDYYGLAVSHLKKRSTNPELHWDINNVQLVNHATHEQQERRQFPEDLRPKDFKHFVKQFKEVINGRFNQ